MEAQGLTQKSVLVKYLCKLHGRFVVNRPCRTDVVLDATLKKGLSQSGQAAVHLIARISLRREALPAKVCSAIHGTYW